MVNRRQPTKLSRAHELSAKGAERKRPAGEIMCSEAAVKAYSGGKPGKTTRDKLNSANTESKWAA